MKTKQKILKILKNPLWGLIYLNNRGLHFLNDKKYISLLYRLSTGEKLNWQNPQTFNEKLQWLKLYDRKDIYTVMVDKYEAKEYVAKIIGEEYIIPTLGVYDNFDDIDFSKLPDKFVIKTTHDSAGVVIVKEKEKMDINKTKKLINSHLKRKFYYGNREWPYKNVKPRIIIEKYMEDKEHKSMRDFKFFCFNGVPTIMYLSEGLEDHSTARMSFYDMDFNLVDCKRKDYKQLDYVPKKPLNFEKMKKFAAILSKGIPHLRVDFYEIDGQLYFGELTFFPASGMNPFTPPEWDEIWGSWIHLPCDKNI